MSGSSPPPNADEPESSRPASEMAALRRMLMGSEGTFSLSFRVFHARHLRDEFSGPSSAELAARPVLPRPRRPAGVRGFVGAGGLGQQIEIAMRRVEHHRTATLIAELFLLVALSDFISSRLRRKFA